MATWAQIGEENLRAAKLLLDHGHFRGAVSRAYYAAYATLTGVFREANVRFAHGDLNPSHDQLLSLATHNLDPRRFGATARRRMRRATAAMQAARIAADYDPRNTIDRQLALQMVRHAAFVVTVVEEC